MSLSGSCVIEIVGGRIQPQTVPFAFDSEQAKVMNGFFAEAEKLEQSMIANGGFAVSLNLKGDVRGAVTFTGVEPSDDQRAIYLHRIRPFQLKAEPYHFGKVKNAIARGTAESAFMQAYLRRTADMFSGVAMQEQIRIGVGDVILNSEVAFDAWLNAVEYHRDETKMLSLLKGRPLPNGDLARRVFVMLLRAKVDAVLAVGNVIHRMFSYAPESGSQDA